MPSRPHVYKIALNNGPVGGPGVTESLWVTLPAIAKTNEIVDTCIANEYIAGRLGQFIGLPLAPGAIVEISRAPKVHGYASLKFGLAGEELPDIDPELVVIKMPREATGLVLFDILIANPDRHEGNLSALVHGDRPQMLVFDHSHALLGYDSSIAIERMNDLRDTLGMSGGSATGQNANCLLEYLKDETHFSDWVQRIKSIPDFMISDLCNEMRNMHFITDVHAVYLTQFIRYRRNNFETIINNHKDAFKGINQWGLSLW